MKRAGHTSCQSGKKVRILLRTGEVIITKFLERTPRFIITEAGKYTPADIDNFTIYKPRERK